MIDVFNIILELLFWREDYKFSKRKKERRKLEKENNLPKKIMIHPAWKLLGIILVSVIIAQIAFSFLVSNFVGEKRTKEKISKIEDILENEIKSIGKYPEQLGDIIRNNPLRLNITYDYWNNTFHYE